MIWKECVLLDECYFLSVKHCHHWSLLLLYLVAPKGAVFVLTFTYCSRSKSIAFMRSEMDSSCSATLLRRTNSLECWICFFGTLAMKFLSRNTRKYFWLWFVIFGQRVDQRVVWKRKISLHFQKRLRNESLELFCCAPSSTWVVILWNKNAEIFIPFSALRIINLSCALSTFAYSKYRALKALMNRCA